MKPEFTLMEISLSSTDRISAVIFNYTCRHLCLKQKDPLYNQQTFLFAIRRIYSAQSKHKRDLLKKRKTIKDSGSVHGSTRWARVPRSNPML